MTQPAATDSAWQIASFVLQFEPEQLANLQQRLEQFDDVAIRIIEKHDDGRLAIVAESGDPAAMRGLVDELQQLPGVHSATLVYHEEGSDDSEPI